MQFFYLILDWLWNLIDLNGLQDEQEAALKQLRKNLKFKAKPVPNFYYEAPPAKPELKKVSFEPKLYLCSELSIVLLMCQSNLCYVSF